MKPAPQTNNSDNTTPKEKKIMSDSGVKIEVHLIQNFAPSNLNRDDTGQPKSATFGGFRRARISSQCSKRCARNAVASKAGTSSVGKRTKLLKAELTPRLKVDGRTAEQIGKALDTFITQLYSKMDGDKTAVPAVSEQGRDRQRHSG